METVGIEPTPCSVQARGALPEHVPATMRTGGVEPPQPEAARLQRVELTSARASARGRLTGFEPVPRGSQPRVLTVTPQPPRKAGTTGLEPATCRLTSECSCR